MSLTHILDFVDTMSGIESSFGHHLFSLNNHIGRSFVKGLRAETILDAGAGRNPVSRQVFQSCRPARCILADNASLPDRLFAYELAILCNIENTAIESNKMDGTLAIDVLHLSNKQQIFMHELWRTLHKDGKLFISSPIRNRDKRKFSHILSSVKLDIITMENFTKAWQDWIRRKHTNRINNIYTIKKLTSKTTADQIARISRNILDKNSPQSFTTFQYKAFILKKPGTSP
jgi:ubiquinone/menaquinone biosynthesis C-methylase UbiE